MQKPCLTKEMLYICQLKNTEKSNKQYNYDHRTKNEGIYLFDISPKRMRAKCKKSNQTCKIKRKY